MAGQTFPALGAPTLAGGARVIASPFQFVGDADTWLRVTSVCSSSGVVLAVQGRRLDDQGVLKAITETHAPNSNRTVATTELLLGAGALLNLTVFASSGSPLVGQCYVMIQLLRSHGATAIVLGTLLGGYVTATQALGFPGSPVVSSTQGEPSVRTITGTTPAAGNGPSETVPTGARWQLLNFWTELATDATPGNRQLDLQILHGGVVIANAPVGFFVPPSATWQVNWAPNFPEITNSAFQVGVSAIGDPTLLLAGDVVRVVTLSLAAADQFFAPLYTVREWLEVA